jgi:acetoacetate decarboxylase
MKVDGVRKRAFAMPLTSPAFPPGPYRFVDREYRILSPHALAPVAALPAREVISATHMIADLTLGLGRVVYDYLKD